MGGGDHNAKYYCNDVKDTLGDGPMDSGKMAFCAERDAATQPLESFYGIDGELALPLSGKHSVGGKSPLVVLAEGDSALAREYAANGFAVLMCRSETYAQRAIERDKEKCLQYAAKMVEYLEGVLASHDELDGGRVVMDGWLCAWALTQTNRFCAAVQREAMINPSTAYGNCDAGRGLLDAVQGGTLLEKMRELASLSVLTGIDGCKTPLLILYDHKNARYSREQSEQLYSAMKDRNPDVPCRMAVSGAGYGMPNAAGEKMMKEAIDWCERFVAQQTEQADGGTKHEEN